MKSTRLLRMLVTVLLFASLVAEAAGPVQRDTLLGRYWFPERDGQFEVYKKAGRYFGRVISFDEAGQLDENNTDPELRSRPFVGIDMLAGFEFDASESRWTDGTIYDPKSGKTYDCNLWFDVDEPQVLQARGYIGFSFLGRTETFDRVVANP